MFIYSFLSLLLSAGNNNSQHSWSQVTEEFNPYVSEFDKQEFVKTFSYQEKLLFLKKVKATEEYYILYIITFSHCLLFQMEECQIQVQNFIVFFTAPPTSIINIKWVKCVGHRKILE